jgi:hypothetical protein
VPGLSCGAERGRPARGVEIVRLYFTDAQAGATVRIEVEA